MYQSVNKNTMPTGGSDQADESGDSFLHDLWKSKVSCNVDESLFIPRPNVSKFAIHEATNLGIQPQIQPKGSAMKTPFR